MKLKLLSVFSSCFSFYRCIQHHGYISVMQTHTHTHIHTSVMTDSTRFRNHFFFSIKVIYHLQPASLFGSSCCSLNLLEICCFIFQVLSEHVDSFSICQFFPEIIWLPCLSHWCWLCAVIEPKIKTWQESLLSHHVRILSGCCFVFLQCNGLKGDFTCCTCFAGLCQWW